MSKGIYHITYDNGDDIYQFFQCDEFETEEELRVFIYNKKLEYPSFLVTSVVKGQDLTDKYDGSEGIE